MTKMKRPWGCFAGTHGAILSVDGEFYPCARFASKKLLPMSGEEYNFEYWQDKLNPRQYDKCKSCKLYKVCNAGCSYSQIRNNNEPVDSVCEINHIFFDETLRMAEKCKNMPAYREYVRNVFTGKWDEKMMPQNANIKDIKESIKIAAYGSEALPYKEVAAYG
jgi:radical SAM protein with 4Fe4S-binding SPASM domain